MSHWDRTLERYPVGVVDKGTRSEWNNPFSRYILGTDFRVFTATSSSNEEDTYPWINKSDLYIVEDPPGKDRGAARRLTAYEGLDADPYPSLDGRSILFVSNRDGDLDIYRITVDGDKLVYLTENDCNDYSLVVLPAP
jgi:Tol biopolymer transport system component